MDEEGQRGASFAFGLGIRSGSDCSGYTSDGGMPIDNNILEREIIVFATGRNSWLFSDTATGAKASAVIYSLMLTSRASGVDPLAWLRHVLTELPQRDEAADIGDLLAFNFSKTSAT